MPTIQIFSSYNYETLSGLSVRAASCLRQTLRTVATRDLPNSWRFNAETAWCKENPSESFAMKGETMKHVKIAKIAKTTSARQNAPSSCCLVTVDSQDDDVHVCGGLECFKQFLSRKLR